MDKIFRPLKTGTRLTAFLVLTLILGPLQILVIWISPRKWSVIPMLYHRGLLAIVGVKVRVHGDVPPPGSLLASNHVSWLDIVLIGSRFPVSFVAKSEVRTWPVFGQLAMLQKTIFIRRERGRHTLGNRDLMRDRLSAGDRLVLFAEGTTGNGAGAMPFKSALFSSVQCAPEDNSSDNTIAVHPTALSYTALDGHVMTQALRDQYAWLGDAALVPHLLFTLATKPLTIDIAFHPALPASVMHDRKQIARAACEKVDASLVHFTTIAGNEDDIAHDISHDAGLDVASESR